MLYGTRDAANAWDEFFNSAANDQGYDIGLSSPCLYYHREEDSHGCRDGDDLVDHWLDALQKTLV